MSRLRILHLEDSLLDADLIHAKLSRGGFEADVTRVDSREGFLAELDRGGFDLILADYLLPSFDGIAALAVAHAQRPDTPFIFVSGTLGEELATETLKQGATDYVVKQRLDRLIPAIDRALSEAGQRRERRRAEQERDRLLEETRRAMENAERQTRQLEGLAQAAVAVTSAVGIDELLHVLKHWLQTIIVCDEVIAELPEFDELLALSPAANRDGEVADGHANDGPITRLDVDRLVRQENRPIRVPRSAHRQSGAEREAYLAVPLISRGGQNLGYVRLSSRKRAEFSKSDEAAVVQMAQLASVAAENIRFYKATQAARAEAEAANRMKDQFLATLSHELRTPLNAILGWATLLSRGNLAPQEMMEAASVIERNTKVQSQLIDDLLDISRIISGKLRLAVEPVHLPEVISAALAATAPAAEAKGVTIQTHISGDACDVRGDPARLQQVIWNLVSNAVKFTPRGGTIDIRCHRSEDSIEISVTDTGCGIEPAFLPFVFDRFRQADGSSTRMHGGLGLGLSIVRQLVEMHGGQIWVTSPGLGQGATFTVSIPKTEVRDEHPLDEADAFLGRNDEPSSLQKRMASLLGLRVLIVDDERDSRDLAGRVLANSGAQILAASGVDEALDVLSQSQADVLVSDISMPLRDGYDLIREVRRRGLSARDLPAIALTAFARDEDRTMAIHAGYQVHLSKPIDPTRLTEIVAQLAGQPGQDALS
jgi:signal transduction histidine kinase/DNA-binding response OmpR family regulator